MKIDTKPTLSPVPFEQAMGRAKRLTTYRIIVRGKMDSALDELAWFAGSVRTAIYHPNQRACELTVVIDHHQLERWFAASSLGLDGALLFYTAIQGETNDRDHDSKPQSA